MKYCLDNQVQTVLDIPYFDHEFWPITIEESIEKDRRKQEVETTQAMKDEDFDDSFESEDPTEISGKCKSVNTYEKKNLKKTPNQMSNCTNLLSIIFSTMAKYKEQRNLHIIMIDVNNNVAFFYYCTVCEDFNLCEKSCNIKPRYKHKMKCSVSSIVDMKQSYEQNSLNSTDLKSKIEKQKATCLQADQRYMEAMTMSQEKNIMQV
ncbi:unnamed protein product [Rotaria sp. Silwood2]|nr:unnamed protein product [Rotaria sp. Silwood2]